MNPARLGLVIVVGVCLVMVGFIAVSQGVQGIGYPLDDAWIHQTYARNLGQWGEWAFIRGQASAGSTAPLWTFLLTIGYLFHINHFVWTFLLGGLCLVATALLGMKSIGTGAPSAWFALFLVSEWHLVWSALSGMETLLFAALITAVLFLCAQANMKKWIIGLLVGISTWVRPDGITLLGPVVFIIMFLAEGKSGKLKSIIKVMVGFLGGFLPYMVFNYFFAGTVFPNTFFAKQAEYAILQQQPILQRAFSLLSLPMIGAGFFLLPGFLFAVFSFFHRRNAWGMAAFLWWLGFTLIYVLRLPVTYQHGRYLIPAMPVFWLIGWIGSTQLLGWLKARGRVGRLVKFGAITGLLLTTAAFLGLGGYAYALDVAIINTEMVASARWINTNTPPNAVIGAHDIGALGYFGHRKIIDLAGLISPEVIPFIRDESRLLNFLVENQASYLMTFPNWYPSMTGGLPQVFSSQGEFSPDAGGENMAIYSLQK